MKRQRTAPGRGDGCPRRRIGSVRRGGRKGADIRGGPSRRMPAGRTTTRRRWGRRVRWDCSRGGRRQRRRGSVTWRGTYLNGWRTGTNRERRAAFAGAPGSSNRGSCGRRSASGTNLSTGTSISVFVAPGKFLDSFFFFLSRRAAPGENFFGRGMPGQSDDCAPVAVSKAYDFVLWLLPKVEKFSRAYRFTVGERLSASGLDVLLLLVEAAYAPSKEDLLSEATRKVNATRYLLRLDLHPAKSRIYRTADGVSFLGWRVFPDRCRLAPDNVVRFRRRMRGLQSEYGQGKLEWPEVRQRVQAWIAHAAHGNTWKLREGLLAQFAFWRGAGSERSRGLLEQPIEEPAGVEPQQERT